MSELKERIPDETALSARVYERAPTLAGEVRLAVGDIESAFIRYRKQIKWGIGVVVLFVITFPLLGPLWVMTALIWVPLLIYVAYRYLWPWWRAGREIEARFHEGVNKILFREALLLLGLTGERLETQTSEPQKRLDGLPHGANTALTPDQISTLLVGVPTAGAAETLNHLNVSELITEEHNGNVVGDVCTLRAGERTLTVAELDISHTTGSGKNRHTKHIFHGYFVTVSLWRPLLGKTFISTEGDTSGVGHQTFWNDVLGGEAKETQLEWNEFENLLHVATTDGAEARYILSTDFMHDLYEWWKEKPGNIRLSFIGQSMYILFPDDRVRLGSTIPRIESPAIAEYMLSISRPLMHVVHLIEDVKV